MSARIAQIPFGRTGHHSSRILFGAAALGGMKQERADAVLELLLEFGVNHIDTAATSSSPPRRASARATRRASSSTARSSGWAWSRST